jgi:hypothetical protein
MKPHDSLLEAVEHWLHGHGFHGRLQYSSVKNVITLSVPVREAEKILNTTYSVFKHDDGTEVVRTTAWSLPEHLHEHIISIQPTTSFLRASSNDAKLRLDKRADLVQQLLRPTGLPVRHGRRVPEGARSQGPGSEYDARVPVQQSRAQVPGPRGKEVVLRDSVEPDAEARQRD